MDQRLKEEGKDIALKAAGVFGRWLLTRPRIVKVLKKRPLLAKLVGVK